MSRRSQFLTVAILISGLYLLPAADPAPPDYTKIGAVKTLFRDADPKTFPAMTKEFQSVMLARTGLKGEMITLDSAEQLRQQLADGTVQLGVSYGVEFGWMLAKLPDLEVLMINGVEPDSLKKVVVVAKGSPARRFADCRGQKLTLPKGNREDARRFLSRLCRQSGAGVAEYFSETRESPTIEDALDEVVDAAGLVTVTDVAALQTFQRRKPGRFSRLRVLEESDPFPPSAIVYHRDKLDPATRRKFTDGMTDAHTSAAGGRLMTLMKIKRFEPVPTDYLPRVAQAVKDYPPP